MDSKKHVVIAIDGYSSCGKSTLAKDISKALHILYVDSGAMYRAITLHYLQHHINPEDKDQVIQQLEHINIRLSSTLPIQVYLNNQDVTDDIRSLHVSRWVSEISAISEVRSKMVDLQRQMANHQSLVMDGRDIGTVVFPNADVKLFITADPYIRAKRRQEELIQKGNIVNLEEIMDNLIHRDHIDSTRADSPLKQASDAILIDNSNLTMSSQLELALRIIKEKLS